MYESTHSWRRRLRVQSLVEIARKELDSGKNFDEIYELLDKEMQNKWNLAASTKNQYLEMVEKVLNNQLFLERPVVNF